ncbi:MAG: SAM-dependent methyltransferase [Ignavibacteria bacterium]|jgi:methyltransferase (TIGR00027 family)
MLKTLKRITYYVDDIEKAKHWYNTVLDIQPTFDTPFAKIYNIGNCSLSLVKSKTPMNEANNKMDVYWEVDDIDSAFEKFVHHGARIQTPIKQVLNTRIAQVIDPFGNIIGLTGESLNQEDRTVEKQPSETALSVAFCRALASKESRKELKGLDYLAELFLTDEAKKILYDDDSRKWAIENLVTSPLYGYFIARTAFIDSIFNNACDDDIPQIVFIGAGYDTRSYRLINKLETTKIFELDIKTTQQRKIEILQKNKINIPNSLLFIPINFTTDNMHDVLFKAGYNSNKKTLFIWEGVTYYLTKEEIERTMNFIQKYSPEGSILCFDYMVEKRASIHPSEPFQFWITKEKIEEMLSNYGIKIDEHIDSTDMTKRYLTLQDGTIAGSILSSFCFIKAVVVK